MAHVFGIDFAFDAIESDTTGEPGAVKNRVCLLKSRDFKIPDPGALQPHDIDSNRFNIEAGIKEVWRRIEVDARIPADHRKAADFRMLVYHDPAGNECLVFDLDVTRDERAAAYDGVIADAAIVGNVARGHNVVAIADNSCGFRARSARDGEVFSDSVSIPDAEVTAFAREGLIERVCAEYSSGGDLVVLAQSGPALDVNVGFKCAICAHNYILLDDAIVPDAAVLAHAGARMDAGSSGNHVADAGQIAISSPVY